MHDTDDLKDTLSPQEREKVIRRHGTIRIVGATAGLGLTMVVTLCIAVLDEDALDSANGRLLLTVCIVFAASIFAALLGAGLVERLQQPQRTLIRQAAAVARGNAELGAENAQVAAENALLIDRSGQLVNQLIYEVDALRKSQTIWAEHLTDRMGRLEAALLEVVRQLPDELQRQHWAGFHAAVSQGFAATGTGGDIPPRRQRLNVVSADGSSN